MYHLPNEILLIIYTFSDIQTRLKLNKAFKWSYRAANPFMDKPLSHIISPYREKVYKFNYIVRGH
jgi:hypothetical protein